MSFGFGFGFTKITAAIRAAFSPSSLFAANEPGVWYDPSDLSTLFQDAAGTKPVTAVEQPVGLMLDKSGNGNHAYQTTATSRPVLRARYNLLTKTEQFDDAAWNKAVVTTTSNTSTAPDGATTADTISSSGGTSYINCSVGVTSGVGYKFSVYAKAASTGIIQIAGGIIGFASSYANFDLSDGSKGTVSGCVADITNAGNGWWKCTVTQTASGSDSNNFFIALVDSKTSVRAASLSASASVYIWGASLVPADQAHLPYQRVNTATDYDTVGFPHYLRFDGVDDFLVTPTITPGIDKVQVFAGVRKLSSTLGAITESGTNSVSVNGTFGVFSEGPISTTSGEYGTIGSGSSGYGKDFAGQLAPATGVLTAQFDIAQALATDQQTLRINSLAAVTNSKYGTAMGTGNFLAYPLYIGRRGGTTLPFNGHIYSLIVRFGANLPTATIEKTEKYINTKTRAY